MIKAVIFDMDGVIADTMPLHIASEKKALSEIGVDITWDELKAFSGMPAREIYEIILRRKEVNASAEMLNERKYLLLKGLVHRIKLFSGVAELVAEMRKRGLKLAVASGSRRDFVDSVLRKVGLGWRFDAVVGHGDYEEGKPAPDIYLMTAKKLGVSPRECVVIEDAPLGIKSARSAGMKVIAVTNTFSRRELKGADLITDSLGKLSATKIIRLGAAE